MGQTPTGQSGSPQSGSPTRWGIFLLAYGAGVVGAFQIGKMPSALPDIRAELGLGLVGAGWAISMFNVIGVSCGIAIGAVTDWLGHRRVAVGGLLCIAAASLAGAFAESGRSWPPTERRTCSPDAMVRLSPACLLSAWMSLSMRAMGSSSLSATLE